MMVSLSDAIIVPGQVDVEHGRQVVQHPEGGVVIDINVLEGSVVHAGDILLRLDGASLRSELAIIESQRLELIAVQRRLRAEQDDTALISTPVKLVADVREAPELTTLLKSQAEIFKTHRGNIAAQTELLTKRILQIEYEKAGLDLQVAALAAETGFVEAELLNQQMLLDKGLASATNVLALRRELARLSGAKGELIVARAHAESRILESRNEFSLFSAQEREEVVAELAAVTQDILELNERRDALEKRVQALEIRAKVGGIVVDLRVTSPGSVVRPADPLLFIVPQDRPLVVIARVPLRLVGDVRPGQEASLHFTGQAARSVPEPIGLVSTVSADAFRDENDSRAYFRVEIVLANDMTTNLRHLHILPGTQLDVSIRTEARRPWTSIALSFGDIFRRALSTS